MRNLFIAVMLLVPSIAGAASLWAPYPAPLNAEISGGIQTTLWEDGSISIPLRCSAGMASSVYPFGNFTPAVFGSVSAGLRYTPFENGLYVSAAVDGAMHLLPLLYKDALHSLAFLMQTGLTASLGYGFSVNRFSFIDLSVYGRLSANLLNLTAVYGYAGAGFSIGYIVRM